MLPKVPYLLFPTYNTKLFRRCPEVFKVKGKGSSKQVKYYLITDSFTMYIIIYFIRH